MKSHEVLRIAGRALLRNKMRSFLTMLGVIIGVSAVIAMVAIGEGAKKRVEDTFASMGTDLLILLPGASSRGGSSGGFGSMPTLTWDDLEAIESEVSAVRALAPNLNGHAKIASEDQNWTTNVSGTSPEYFDIRRWEFAAGAPFSEAEVEAGAKVVVLGKTVVEKLFGAGVDPLGQTVRIKNVPFRITGVLEKKGQSPNGQDYDDTAIIPYTTHRSKIQGRLNNFVGGATLISAHPGQTGLAEAQIAALLRDRHHLAAGAEDDFSIRNLEEMANAQQEGTETLTTLLAAIAAVSLLVGGIGIMNIMLVSVTERTREIGVRMAIGGRPRDILLQFLVEALALSVIGGLAGVLIGVFAGAELASKFGWPLLVRPDIIVESVLFSAIVGVVFGLYPARKASRLEPIEALRFE